MNAFLQGFLERIEPLPQAQQALELEQAIAQQLASAKRYEGLSCGTPRLDCLDRADELSKILKQMQLR